MDSGVSSIEDPNAASEIRARARRMRLQAALVSLLLTGLALALP